jgi:long-subunit acyl-CoA synthetase (AMP-forming)
MPPGRSPTTWRSAGSARAAPSGTSPTPRCKETNQFANFLRSLGVGKGDRVFALMGRTPELYVVALGSLKNLSVFSPLFSAFGPEPIHARLSLGEGKVLVTTERALSRMPSAAVIRSQAQGTVESTLDPRAGLRLDKLARYEVHLDRKLERILAMLLKLQDLRRAVTPDAAA